MCFLIIEVSLTSRLTIHLFPGIETTVKSRLPQPPREIKIGLKNRVVQEIGIKITALDREEANDFCFELSRGSWNRNSG